MTFTLIAAVQLISASSVIASDLNSYRCPNDYHFSGGNCYKIEADVTDYEAAQAHCEVFQLGVYT